MYAKPITDPRLIAETITHPKIYPHVSDDGSPKPEDYEPAIAPALLYLGMYQDDGAYLGLFAIHPHNSRCYEVHTCLLPEAWGKFTVECARLCIAYVFANTPCLRLITNVPSFNAHAKRLALRAGMSPFGVNAKSFLKDGVLYDQLMLGISKEDVCQSQEP
jgi:RimJ/RimL family protein N-acetyltransferase